MFLDGHTAPWRGGVAGDVSTLESIENDVEVSECSRKANDILRLKAKFFIARQFGLKRWPRFFEVDIGK